jgi:NAD(P)H-dependent flavin oxidoreductase YrpB (nitropropane dioxygenase family)
MYSCPQHVHKACRAGADIIIAQGGEAGGHTGDIATSVLIPACADICKRYVSPQTSKPVTLVAAGGINDGRSVAAALMLGASGVWIGTRFIVSEESTAPQIFKDQVIAAEYDGWVKLTVWSGRPLRALRNPWLTNWEVNRQQEIKQLTDKGIVPLEFELDRLHKEGKLTDEIEDAAALRPIGVVGGSVNKSGQSAKEIVDEIVQETLIALNSAAFFVNATAKL